MDVKGEDSVRQREAPYGKSSLHQSTLNCLDTAEGKRLRRTVYDEEGDEPLVCGHNEVFHNTKRLASKAKGVRALDHLPKPQKNETSKRCYEWIHRPSGYENPVQYDEPCVPGVRPSHPISSGGVPETGHKRIPDMQKAYPATGIPAPYLSEPDAGKWGGWGPSGEPGRRRLDRPWEIKDKSYDGEGESCKLVVGDMSKKKFSDQRYQNTSALTSWHFDPENDMDKILIRKIHHCEATAPDGSGRLPHVAPAGKATGACAEGSCMQWYDTVRGREAFFSGHTPGSQSSRVP